MASLSYTLVVIEFLFLTGCGLSLYIKCLCNAHSVYTQVDAYINSTNESLDLSQGTVSKALLEACGSDLQDENILE